MTRRERFAEEYGMDLDRVHKLVRMAAECKSLNERYSNGDPHPESRVSSDKNRNAELWSNALDVATAELVRFVQQYGFDGVAYTGLAPTLKRAGRYVEVPF
jgi:hypothetical protein